mgnify:CR=1 FL=1
MSRSLRSYKKLRAVFPCFDAAVWATEVGAGKTKCGTDELFKGEEQ